MAEYARKKWSGIFKANITLLASLIAPGVVLLVPAAAAFTAGMLFPAIALLIIAASVYIPYAALLCFGYTVTCTAIVLDGTGLGKGIRAAWTYISKNKAKMAILICAYAGTLYAAALGWSVLHIPTRHPALLRRIL